MSIFDDLETPAADKKAAKGTGVVLGPKTTPVTLRFRLMRMSAVSRGILPAPWEAEDDSQPTGYELAPCMDKAATANRESVRDKNFIHRML